MIESEIADTLERGPAADGLPRRTRLLRLIEFAALFIGGPVAVAYFLPKRLLIPSIMAFGLLALMLLLTDGTFDRRQLWNWKGARAELPRICAIAALGAIGTVALVLIIWPELFLSLPRNRPWLWLAIMIGYPLASVYPQEVIYRALIFHRYQRVLGGPLAAAVASAMAFGFAHIVLWNWLAIAATLVGGALFSWTYLRTRSVAATALEHAMYGCLMFTVGLGRFFYGGTIA